MEVSIRHKGEIDGFARVTRPPGRRIHRVVDTRGAHAYALGYWGMVGWKMKILIELSTPLTVVVTSAWDSFMSIVVVGSAEFVVNIQPDLFWNCATRSLSGKMVQGEDAAMSLLRAPRWGLSVGHPCLGTVDVTLDLPKTDRVVSFQAEVERRLLPRLPSRLESSFRPQVYNTDCRLASCHQCYPGRWSTGISFSILCSRSLPLPLVPFVDRCLAHELCLGLSLLLPWASRSSLPRRGPCLAGRSSKVACAIIYGEGNGGGGEGGRTCRAS